MFRLQDNRQQEPLLVKEIPVAMEQFLFYSLLVQMQFAYLKKRF